MVGAVASRGMDKMIEAYYFRRLFIFRSLVIVAELALVGLAAYGLNVVVPIANILIVIAMYASFNLLAWMRLNNKSSVSAQEFFLHLCVDVLALAAVLYFLGGSSNPFVSMFLLPLVIVAATLPKRFVWAMATVTLVCYSLLIALHIPLPEAEHNMQYHVLGMWFSFLLGVGVILFFVVSMAEALRQRDRKLAEASEKRLRDEHVISLGTMAAGAAHELGTPLGIMAILTKEMRYEYGNQTELVEKLDILRSQVDRCKTTLGQISVSAGQLRAEGGYSESIRDFVHNTLTRWQQMHPATTMSVTLNGHDPAPVVIVDETLKQAVVNLLNNAAEASPEQIEVCAAWSGDNLHMTIRDFGEGLSQTVMNELGNPFFTTKEDGHGLGFYLTQAVVSRLGGEVDISNHPEGGARMIIRLPLNRIMAG